MHALSGSAAIPAIPTRRGARSMTNNTMNVASPFFVQTSVVKTSVAASEPRYDLMNSLHFGGPAPIRGD
jgi:hypothetical protein